MNNPASKLLHLASWVAAWTVFLIPLTVIPLTQDAYDLPKTIVLIVGTCLVFLLITIDGIKHKRMIFGINRFTVPLSLLTVSYVISFALASPNKWQTLTIPGSVGTMIILWMWFILLSILTTILPQTIHRIRTALSWSTAIVCLITILGLAGVLSRLPLPLPYSSNTFTPMSSPLTTLVVGVTVFMLSGIPLMIKLLGITPPSKHAEHQLEHYWNEEEKKSNSNPALSLAAIIILIGISASIYQLTTTAKPILLPQWAGWNVAVETLKNPKSALVGVGPANYVSAFTLGRPVELNNTPVWNLRFSASSNTVFQTLSEVGLIGLISLAIVLAAIIKSIIEVRKDPTASPFAWSLALGALAVSMILLPTSVLGTIVLFTLAGTAGSFFNSKKLDEDTVIVPYLLGGIALVTTLVSFYGFGRATYAEMYFKETLDAVRANNAQKAYNSTAKAIEIMPQNDLYHVTAAQTNLSIANGLATKKELTDQEKNTISTLIQQAIREGKAAIGVNPTRAANWENLANIYRNLINIAEDADDWALQVYKEAIRLDPTNPLLRLNLGGIFYRAGNMEAAIDQFKVAVGLKKDFANGYYNLAAAYKEKGERENAIAAIKEALKYVDKNSADYIKAQEELKNLESGAPLTPQKEATSSGQLTTPPASPSAEPEESVELPEESAPPTGTSLSPTPTATPTKTQPTPNL